MGEGVRDREVIEPTFGTLGGHSIHYVLATTQDEHLSLSHVMYLYPVSLCLYVLVTFIALSSINNFGVYVTLW